MILCESKTAAISQGETVLPRRNPQQAGPISEPVVEWDDVKTKRIERLVNHRLGHSSFRELRHNLGQVD